MFKRLMRVLCVLALGSYFAFTMEAVANERGPVSPESRAFYELPLTWEDKAFIKQFVIDFSNKSMDELMADRDNLERLKVRFDGIHPLRFAGFVFSDPEMRQYAKSIMATDGKSHVLVALVYIQIKQRVESGVIHQYMPGFVDYCGADRNTVQSFIGEDNYRGLIEYLLQL